MPSLDFGELRRRIPICRVLELLCFQPVERREPRLRGCCPIHDSPRQRNRHFSVHLEKNCFRCFVCAERGNQLDLWAITQKLPIHAAAVDLCGRLGIDVPYRP